MAKSNFTQSLCFLYLIVSGHLLVDCRRVKTLTDDRQQDGQSPLESSLAQQDANFEELTVGKATVSHPWCNWFSRQTTRSYHFDVEVSDQHCEDGACMAIELIRHKDHPELHIHAGQSWLVTKDDDGEIQWTARSVSDKQYADQETVMDLIKTEAIKFFPSNTDFPDKLEIHMEDVPDHLETNKSAHSGKKAHQVFTLAGGLFYSEELLAMGFKELTHEKMQAMEDSAAEATHGQRGRDIGKKVGFGGAIISVGGMYTAATITGVAVQTQALIGASILGVVGGTIGGAVIGGLVGAAIAASIALAGSTQIKGYKVISGSRKIFEKLRCIDEFTHCGDNVLVPNGKKCPQKN